MKIVGSIKINTNERKKLFLHNLDSLEPISSMLSWDFNIDGIYGEFCRSEITRRYSDAKINLDDTSSYYDIVIEQIDRNNDLLFFWQEDHWFICPKKEDFLYVLDKFQKSGAEKLTITHLVDLWRDKSIHQVLVDDPLYKEYLVNLNSQKKLWEKYPDSYLTTLPTIYKKNIAKEILELNKDILKDSKRSKGFELYKERAVKFLSKRSFIETIPTFHVLREVFKSTKDERAISMKEALQIIKLRGEQKNLQNLNI